MDVSLTRLRCAYYLGDDAAFGASIKNQPYNISWLLTVDSDRAAAALVSHAFSSGTTAWIEGT